MGNIENLRPVQTKTEARERGRNGGIKSGEARREKKLFKEAIEKKLGKNLNSIIDALMLKAANGDVSASVFLRDTIGEKPTDKVDMNNTISYEDAIKEVVDTDEY